MAHIPYGYRIENGKAVIVASQADQIRDFFQSYLSGLSIKNAFEQSGIQMSLYVAKHMLQNTIYLGDGYYPRILDEETFNAVADERARRRARMGRDHMPSRAIKPISVKTRFRMVIPMQGTDDACKSNSTSAAMNHSSLCGQKKTLTPAEKVKRLYACIVPDDNGGTTISDEDRHKVGEWIKSAENNNCTT